ncbi:hypothetical protein P7M41_27030, partial [Vibrio parahaemolyticus]|nr:hypothetical protein [Vibrio parahaemolyticus]
PLTYADVVRGITHDRKADALLVCKPFEFKPIWPQSVLAEKECTHSYVEDWLTELRPQSPQSEVSDTQRRPLSPDSPVPQFTSVHVGYHVELSRQRSFTPQSTISDWEGTDMCLETLFDETRAESPQSVISDFELDKLFNSRALSPESVSSDFDFSLLQDWLADFRA